MNAIQKAASAATALAITVVGAALVTAPMAFARPVPAMARDVCSMPSLQVTVAGHIDCNSSNRDAGLIALNRR